MTASKLVKPSEKYKDSFLEAVQEYADEGSISDNELKAIKNNFTYYLEKLNTPDQVAYDKYQDWVEPVPETVLWLVKDNHYIGTLSIRHRLNWHLEKWGGHVHYKVRPSLRNKGFGKKMLYKAMPYANQIGLEKVLITMNTDNQSSIHIIEKMGGKHWDVTQKTESFPAQTRYWLETQ
ncbi:MAG: GNAT family N-acetyltransferase [Micavibrio sp.]|nr:GNAT family N-acetyltransferase [Micavibrio sp.]|tara:strand:- start:414 stop:947 length:534 start_codon:yes stop_codon:yes gene_type:complete